jgi:ribonucleoside-diphosphate reductase alpha chain
MTASPKPRSAVRDDVRAESAAASSTGDTHTHAQPNGRKPGLKMPRRFTQAGEDPFASVRWERRTSRIRDEAGNTVSERANAEIPVDWSQVATDIMVSKYFRRAGVPQFDADGHPIHGADGRQLLGSETSAKQVIKRLTNCWRWWGEHYGYFASPDDARSFEEELQYMLVHQMAAPNSPQWFNTGLHLSYGLTGPAQGHYYVEPDTGELKESQDAYSHPQPHACFIQSVRDSLLEDGGIMDLATREARVFKYGSGTGTNFSSLREAGAPLSGGGASSGLMSWLRIFDRAAGAIKSGGTTRRAAKMVILDADHPDIEQFVWWKAREEKKVAALVAAGYPSDFNGEAYQTVSGQNSNNTVRVSNEFLTAVEGEGEWALRSRIPGRGIVKTLKARKLWRDIAEAAWLSADPGVQYDTTIQEWHTCPASGRINATNPCSEYVFLDDTACNLASINVMKFVDEETGAFDIEGYVHAIRLWTVVLEISVLMAQFPSKAIAQRSYEFRTLGLGYANLGTLLMVWGIPYDSPKARAIGGALTAILTGESYATSARMAAAFGAFPKFSENRDFMLRVIRNHRRAAYAAPEAKYEGLSVKPVPIDQDVCPQDLRTAAHRAWDAALDLGEKHGFRNAQVTVIAPTGTIGLLMDCDTTGVEPDFALVKFKKLAGGGYFKIVNQSVPKALQALGYSSEQIHDIVRYISGTLSFTRAPAIDREALREKKFTDDDIAHIEKQLPGVFSLTMAFTPASLGDDLIRRLGLTEKAKENPMLEVLSVIGFSAEEIETANEEICGRLTIEGAPHLKPEHVAVFDCANKCGPKGLRFIASEGHIRMLGATQPFVSGSLSKTINMPAEATIEDIERAYLLGWKLGLKANALYRDGSKLSQPLSTSSSSSGTKVTEKVVEKVIERVVEKPHRVKLPRERQAITRKVNLAGQEFYVTVGLYPDGKPGELFITMSQEGTFASGMADAFAKMVSIALQYGVPIDNMIRQLRHMRFAPDGFTGDPDITSASSVVDFLSQWLAKTFPGGMYATASPLPFPERPPAVADGGPATMHPVPGMVMTVAQTPVSDPLQGLGFTGDKCSNCSSIRMVQSGTCKKCLDCGETTGCS